MGLAGAKSEVLGAAFGIEAAGDCDRLQERGLAGAILSDKESNRRVEYQRFEVSHRGERERKSLE